MRHKAESLTGWGQYPVVPARIMRPERYHEFTAYAQQAATARGAGRAYGDAAISFRGTTVLSERVNRLLDFDPVNGVLRAEAGVTLDDIIRTFLPRGWFLPVTPGTRFVSLGGAIAADVHGKNHPSAGSFARCVDGFWLYTPSGEFYCSREQNSALFAATLGGMGMTGFIGEVTLRLRPVNSSELWLRSQKAGSLAELLALFSDPAMTDEYQVAWLDCLATGTALGRGVFTSAHHADDAPLLELPEARLRMPIRLPTWVLNRLSVRTFNRAYYHWQGRHQRAYRQDLAAFFYPLDGITDWYRLYGKPGFVQYQCVVPTEHALPAFMAILQAVQAQGFASFLAVIKRLGAASGGLLSFPQPGLTLALDLPRRANTLQLIAALDAVVLAYQGRVYLAKDAGSRPESIRAMYPQLGEWQAVRANVDPEGLMVSALGQRLELV